MSQCSSNPCELRETQKLHVHVSSNPCVKPGGTGFGKPVAPVLCQPAQRLVFEFSVAPSLGTRWHWFSLKFVTASFGKSGVSGVCPKIPGFNSNG
jgi:hypothetical protein